jgi:carbon-monoxide dehydrogenase medium subunit
VKPAAFAYARPNDLADAARLLASQAARASLLAGGQSLLPLMTRRLVRPGLIIDINRIAGLDDIELLPTQVRMGALVRQEQALRSPLVKQHLAAVAEALAWVANPVVRQRGAVVGNLIANTPGAELPAVAIALGAEFVVRCGDAEKRVHAADWLGAGRAIPVDVLVTHVLWPRRAGAAGFFEVARRDGHAPVVSAMVTLHGDDCRVAVSGVCAAGLSCPSMAQVIARAFPHPPHARDLARALQADLAGPPYGDPYSSAAYRLEVAPVVVQRAAAMMALQAASA